jgi:hypothetical protein
VILPCESKSWGYGRVLADGASFRETIFCQAVFLFQKKKCQAVIVVSI